MPNVPIAELIRQNVVETLSEITTDNDYNYTLNVQSWNQNGTNTELHLDAIVIPQQLETETNKTMAYYTWNQKYIIEVYIRPADTDTTPTDTYLHLIYADILSAIMQDRSRGGYAINTMIDAPVGVQDKNGIFHGLLFNLTIPWRHSLYNATQQ